jgi:hypothetical protein
MVSTRFVLEESMRGIITLACGGLLAIGTCFGAAAEDKTKGARQRLDPIINNNTVRPSTSTARGYTAVHTSTSAYKQDRTTGNVYRVSRPTNVPPPHVSRGNYNPNRSLAVSAGYHANQTRYAVRSTYQQVRQSVSTHTTTAASAKKK